MCPSNANNADRRREALGSERSGFDLDALAIRFAELEEQHETQKATLDTLTEEVEVRKQAVLAVQDGLRQAQNELAEVRKHSQEKRGRLSSLETLQAAALGQEQGAAVEAARHASNIGGEVLDQPAPHRLQLSHGEPQSG